MHACPLHSLPMHCTPLLSERAFPVYAQEKEDKAKKNGKKGNKVLTSSLAHL